MNKIFFCIVAALVSTTLFATFDSVEATVPRSASLQTNTVHRLFVNEDGAAILEKTQKIVASALAEQPNSEMWKLLSSRVSDLLDFCGIDTDICQTRVLSSRNALCVLICLARAFAEEGQTLSKNLAADCQEYEPKLDVFRWQFMNELYGDCKRVCARDIKSAEAYLNSLGQAGTYVATLF
jgi:hypothetical protein